MTSGSNIQAVLDLIVQIHKTTALHRQLSDGKPKLDLISTLKEASEVRGEHFDLHCLALPSITLAYTFSSSSSSLSPKPNRTKQKKKQVYEKEAVHFLEFIHVVFEKSPFLISAEEAAKVSGCQNDQFTDITVGRMSAHEVCLEVEDEGFEVGWDFTVDGASVSR